MTGLAPKLLIHPQNLVKVPNDQPRKKRDRSRWAQKISRLQLMSYLRMPIDVGKPPLSSQSNDLNINVILQWRQKDNFPTWTPQKIQTSSTTIRRNYNRILKSKARRTEAISETAFQVSVRNNIASCENCTIHSRETWSEVEYPDNSNWWGLW